MQTPSAQYGIFKTADRFEIEGFRSAAATIEEYLQTQPTKPMSIAVSGQPGAGKSFGVKQVIEAVVRNVMDFPKDWKPIETNLS
jgi:pantothenate kinase